LYCECGLRMGSIVKTGTSSKGYAINTRQFYCVSRERKWKGYEVHGIKRRSSSFNTQRIDHIFQDRHDKNSNLLFTINIKTMILMTLFLQLCFYSF